MIREFQVENFFSIKSRQILSFESKGLSADFTCHQINDNTCLNKIEVFYGANASGKSNILFALQTVFKMLIAPRFDKKENVIGYKPFALEKDKPSYFYISFYAESIRYDYEVSFDKSSIISEQLVYYPNGSKSLFYKREFVNDNQAVSIGFGQSLHLKKRAENVFVSNTFNNHTVLSTIAKASFEDDISPVSYLYNWITEHVHDVNGDVEEPKTFAEIMKDVCEDSKMKSFYLQMIKKADFNITNFDYIESERTFTENQKKKIQQNPDFPESFKKYLLEGKEKQVLFTNTTGSGSFDLKSSDQSSGTIEFMKRLRFLYDTISGDHLYFLDEPEEDLHYDLFLFYLNAFLFNSSGSQIILASHLTTLLAEDLINDNRDLVFFVEKDTNTGESQYVRGDRFGLHKNQSLYNAYKIGRLGAKPILGSPFIISD